MIDRSICMQKETSVPVFRCHLSRIQPRSSFVGARLQLICLLTTSRYWLQEEMLRRRQEGGTGLHVANHPLSNELIDIDRNASQHIRVSQKTAA